MPETLRDHPLERVTRLQQQLHGRDAIPFEEIKWALDALEALLRTKHVPEVDRIEQGIFRLVGSLRMQRILEAMSDADIASALLSTWLAEIRPSNPMTELLNTAIDRLFRSQGGPITEEDRELLYPPEPAN